MLRNKNYFTGFCFCYGLEHFTYTDCIIASFSLVSFIYAFSDINPILSKNTSENFKKYNLMTTKHIRSKLCS